MTFELSPQCLEEVRMGWIDCRFWAESRANAKPLRYKEFGMFIVEKYSLSGCEPGTMVRDTSEEFTFWLSAH